MPDIFISYSRKNKEFVQKLHEALIAQEREIWVDWEDIPLTADWRAEIRQGIKESDTVIFVLSPDFLGSKETRAELDQAEAFNKRLIPVVFQDVGGSDVPHSLASLNWIFFREEDDFDEAFASLVVSMDTDLDWVKAHTRLLVRTLEWEDRNRNDSYLLRGVELAEGEQLLAQTDKEPRLTAAQRQYILASRQGAIKRQRIILGAVTLGLIVAVVLAIVALAQSRIANDRRVEADNARATAVREKDRAEEAEALAEIRRRRAQDAEATAQAEREIAVRESQISLAKSLAALALPIVERTNNTELAALLSVEAEKINHAVQGDARALIDSSLRRVLGDTYFNATLGAHETAALAVAVSPDGNTVASAAADGTILLWPVTDPVAEPVTLNGHEDRISSIAFSPDGSTLISASDDETVRVWTVADPTAAPTVLTDHEARVLSVAFSPTGKT
ncbi:MAG: TIR domain-containing protein, partial [Anaerolineae bacterium]|nr:TIR domain-containing protein [Anaerolineae bacterium]